MIISKYDKTRWSNIVDQLSWSFIKGNMYLIILSIPYWGISSLIIYFLIFCRAKVEYFTHRFFITVLLFMISFMFENYTWLTFLSSFEAFRWTLILLPELSRTLVNKIKLDRDTSVETLGTRLLRCSKKIPIDGMAASYDIFKSFQGFIRGDDSEAWSDLLYTDLLVYLNDLENLPTGINKDTLFIIMDNKIIVVWMIGMTVIDNKLQLNKSIECTMCKTNQLHTYKMNCNHDLCLQCILHLCKNKDSCNYCLEKI